MTAKTERRAKISEIDRLLAHISERALGPALLNPVRGPSVAVIFAYFRLNRGQKHLTPPFFGNGFTVSGLWNYKSEPRSQLKWWAVESRVRLNLKKHGAMYNEKY